MLPPRSDRSVPLGELLVRKGLVSRADLQTALARKMGYPLVDVAQFPVDMDAVARLPHAVAARVPALPLVVRTGRLVVAMEDPSNRAAIDEIEFAAQCKLVPVLVRSGVLAEATGDVQLQMLERGEIDAGFMLHSPGFEPPGLARLLIASEPLVVAMPEAHALSATSIVRLDKLLAEPLISSSCTTG